MLPLRSLTTLLLLSVACCLDSPVLAQSVLPPMTNCLDVLKLAPEQANQNHPVKVRGVVTSYVPGSQLCFVQDSSAGIYVQPRPWPRELHVGQTVEIDGVTAQGRFSPIIQWATIRPTGETRSLTPRRISVEELNTGRFDCQYVEIEGVLQKAEASGNVVALFVVAGGAQLHSLIFSLDNPPTNAVDARVRVRGIAGTYYSGAQLTGFGLFLQDASFVEIVRPPPALFSQTVRRLDNLAWYSPEGGMDHRTHVRGTVTLVWPGESFFIRDESGTIGISPANPAQLPAPGDMVQVAGFLRNPTSFNPAIVHAAWRKTGETNTAPPRAMPLANYSSSPPKGQLVTIEGTILAVNSTNDLSVITLGDEGHTIRAFSRQPIPPDLINCTVRVNGVLSKAPAIVNSTETALLLAQTNSLVVVSRPIGVHSPSPSRLITVGSVAAAFLFAAFAWAAHKSSRQTQLQVREHTSRLNESEKEIAQLKDVRERLGRDLHDHIIQSIYAIGLSLEDCRHSLSDPRRLDSSLKSALEEINDVIRELRNVIAGLESNTIQPKEFRTALKSIALTLGQEKSNRIRLELDQAALDALSPSQATELIHIAREAMSNSVRHGNAQTTIISLNNHQDQIRFVVEDDGDGFDPQAASTKGYGLRNMAKRAEDLGAEFTINAQKGVGTRIVLDIPKQKQHLSKL